MGWARPLLLVAALLIGSTSAGSAQTIDLSLLPDDKKKTVDRRSDLTPQAWRMAVFMARDGEPGHAFLALLTFQEDIGGFVTDGVWGLYPGEGDIGRWGLNAVPGSIDVFADDSRPDGALLVWINPSQHQEITDIAEKYKKEGVWQLLFSDCVSLFAESARAAGLSTPLLTLKPYPFLNGVIAGNE